MGDVILVLAGESRTEDTEGGGEDRWKVIPLVKGSKLPWETSLERRREESGDAGEEKQKVFV